MMNFKKDLICVKSFLLTIINLYDILYTYDRGVYMKNKNGFTLIELLAVIVILAIIALIATPVIMSIINSSRQNAAEESAKLVVAEIKLAYEEAYMLCDGKTPSLNSIINKVSLDGIENADIDTENYTVTDGYGTICTLTANDYVKCQNSKYGESNKGNINNIKSKETLPVGDCDIASLSN